MKNLLKKWLIQNLITGLILSGLYTAAITNLTVNATTIVTYTPQQVSITSGSISPKTINPEKGDTATISYCLGAPAEVTLGIYYPVSKSDSKKVAILVDKETKGKGCFTAVWNGKYGNKTEFGGYGNLVNDSEYFYYLEVKGQSELYYGSATSSGWITVDTDGKKSDSDYGEKNLKFLDIEIDHIVFDPWDDQEGEITFTINKEAYITLEIFDEDEEEIVTVINDKLYQKGEYTADWDGKNQFGDIVSQGEYIFKLKAKFGSDIDKEVGKFQIKKGYDNAAIQTKDPRLKNVYTTKEKFDPGRNEKVYIVFTLTAKADVQINIYDKKDNKVAELMNDENKNIGTYKVFWDGEEVLDTKATYTYRIYAKNEKGEEIKEGKIKVEEDHPDTKTANIYKDTVDPIPYSPQYKQLGISFKLEKAAKVSVEIRLGGKVIAKVVEDSELTEGSHTIYWDGMDKYGDVAEDGVYKYKIFAENNKGKDNEEGIFSIEGSTVAKYNTELCAGFTDIGDDYKYCEAIQWAVGAGVVKGYNDGAFRPAQAVNRAEALKMILQALGVKIFASNGDKLGFTDVDNYGWYAVYIKTALSLGIVKGYNDGTFKPYQAVSKVEALIMLLNTAKAKDNVIIPTNNIGQPYYDTPNTPENKWYISYVWFAKAYSLNDNEYYFYPASFMTRGEMAEMLYRYHKADFDN